MARIKKRQKFFVIAHNMRSLYNVGSIFRTADSFNVSKIYLTGYTGTPGNEPHRLRMQKSALGAETWVPWEHCKSPSRLIKKLKSEGVKIVALENKVPAGAGVSRPQSITKFKPKFPLALVLGEEVRGVSKAILKLCDSAVEIPMFGKKESLNVSVAFGIAAYVLRTK